MVPKSKTPPRWEGLLVLLHRVDYAAPPHEQISRTLISCVTGMLIRLIARARVVMFGIWGWYVVAVKAGIPERAASGDPVTFAQDVHVVHLMAGDDVRERLGGHVVAVRASPPSPDFGVQ